MRRGSRSLAAWVVSGALLLAVAPAEAIYETDQFKVQGDVSVQSTIQHDGTSDFDYVQQRQELQLGGIYRVVPENSTSFFRKIDFSLLWRGRYDAIFDIRDRYKDRGYDREDFRFPEGNHPRELYFDIEFNGALQPLSFRLGRQQIVWGEADFFRSLDVINPLRLDQMGLVGDDLDKYREPLWIAKALWHIGGDLPFITSADVEAFYSPDGRPLTNKLILGNGWRIFDGLHCGNGNRIDCKRPHDIPFARRRHPWEIEAVGPEYATAPDQGDTNLDGVVGGLLDDLGIITGPSGGAVSDRADFIYLGNQKHGDRVNLSEDGWHEIDPMNRSMAGIRFMGQTSSGGLYFTLNYIWKRAEIPAPGIGWDTLFAPSNLGVTDVPPTIDNVPIDPDVLLETGANFTQTMLGVRNAEGLTPNQVALADCINNSTPKLIVGPVTNPDPGAPLGRSAYGYPFPDASLGQACVPIPLHYPHTHIFGGTLTYNDYEYTGFIWRIEQSLSTKEPRAIFPALAGTRAGQFPNQRDFDTGGWTAMQLWRSMVGFDYLRAPFQHRALPRWLYNVKLARSLLTDQWFFTFQFFNEYWAHVNRQLGQNFSITNRHQHFNPILTWIMTGFFMNDKLRPTLAFAYETNTQFPVAWLQAQYFINEEIQIRLGSVLYLGSMRDENFLLLNKYADRDTTYLRFTYFFL